MKQQTKSKQTKPTLPFPAAKRPSGLTWDELRKMVGGDLGLLDGSVAEDVVHAKHGEYYVVRKDDSFRKIDAREAIRIHAAEFKKMGCADAARFFRDALKLMPAAVAPKASVAEAPASSMPVGQDLITKATKKLGAEEVFEIYDSEISAAVVVKRGEYRIIWHDGETEKVTVSQVAKFWAWCLERRTDVEGDHFWSLCEMAKLFKKVAKLLPDAK